MSHVLITGGAGFIGSHLADELLARGHRVRALDALVPQVHGGDRARPAYLAPDVELIVGDVRDRGAVDRALRGIDVVFHLAALVGVGQSMYEVAEYTSVNNVGTAVLLEALIAKPVQRLIVASSMSVYGEGLYRDGDRMVVDAKRTPAELAHGHWDPKTETGRPLVPVATPEWKPPALASIYALSKFDQERMALLVGNAYKIPTVALRFFNAYGPRQALSNPYTGVLAIFAARYLNGKPPLIFEDGRQRRDFVHVRDVAAACRLAMERGEPGGVYNVGSGRAITIREVADRMARVLGSEVEPEITGRHRVGDVRHCSADIALAERALGFAPAIDFESGLRDLAGWLQHQRPTDRVEAMCGELATRGLAL